MDCWLAVTPVLAAQCVPHPVPRPCWRRIASAGDGAPVSRGAEHVDTKSTLVIGRGGDPVREGDGSLARRSGAAAAGKRQYRDRELYLSFLNAPRRGDPGRSNNDQARLRNAINQA